MAQADSEPRGKASSALAPLVCSSGVSQGAWRGAAAVSLHGMAGAKAIAHICRGGIVDFYILVGQMPQNKYTNLRPSDV